MKPFTILSLFAAIAVSAPSIDAALVPAPVAAATQDVDALVKSGRAHLSAGRLAQARADFERAHAAAPGLATRVWIWRIDTAEGRHERVLAEISSERRSGAEGPDVEYALGFALLAKADAAIAAGSTANVGFILSDAADALQAAVDGDATRFADAWPSLARARHMAGDAEGALGAARKAVEALPDDAAMHVVLGRSALAVGQAHAEREEKAEAKARFEEAAKAFERAVALAKNDAATLADARVQLGHAHQFAGDHARADAAYAAALGANPEAIDLQQLFGIVGRDRLIGVLRTATRDYERAKGAKDAGDVTLHWWLGWALYDADNTSKEAEAAYLRTLEKSPEYLGAWYWLYRIRLAASRWDAAKEALAKHSEANDELLVQTLRNTDEHEPARVTYLADRLAAEGKLTDAAWTSELAARTLPPDDHAKIAVSWNNAALLWRDAGDRRGGRQGRAKWPAARRAELADIYERSFAAYSKALEIDPDSPAYLNDAAVVLHYNLERDYDKALDMYKRAEENAKKRLADPGLDSDTRGIYEIALRDSRDNAKKLQSRMKGGKDGGE